MRRTGKIASRRDQPLRPSMTDHVGQERRRAATDIDVGLAAEVADKPLHQCAEKRHSPCSRGSLPDEKA
jgi:hypothetical protein